MANLFRREFSRRASLGPVLITMSETRTFLGIEKKPFLPKQPSLSSPQITKWYAPVTVRTTCYFYPLSTKGCPSTDRHEAQHHDAMLTLSIHYRVSFSFVFRYRHVAKVFATSANREHLNPTPYQTIKLKPKPVHA